MKKVFLVFLLCALALAGCKKTNPNALGGQTVHSDATTFMNGTLNGELKITENLFNTKIIGNITDEVDEIVNTINFYGGSDDLIWRFPVSNGKFSYNAPAPDNRYLVNKNTENTIWKIHGLKFSDTTANITNMESLLFAYKEKKYVGDIRVIPRDTTITISGIYFMYADKDVQITGGSTATDRWNINLKKGWNLVLRMLEEESSSRFKIITTDVSTEMIMVVRLKKDGKMNDLE